MKKIAITGGAGFIGSNLAEELSTDNAVIVIDDLSTGKIENIAHLIEKSNVRFVQGNINNLNSLQKLSHGIDLVFHQAAIASVPRSIENPLFSNEANTTGTLNVLLAARDNKVKKVIYASSSSVYGDTPTLPKTEAMLPNPQSPYAAVIPLFVKRLSAGKPPIIFGDGYQTRDFTFIKDVINANIIAAESSITGILNIATGEGITINELAELIANIMGSNLQPIYKEPRPGDIRHSLADISKARVIGYKPQYRLEDGLKEIVRGLRNAK